MLSDTRARERERERASERAKAREREREDHILIYLLTTKEITTQQVFRIWICFKCFLIDRNLSFINNSFIKIL